MGWSSPFFFDEPAALLPNDGALHRVIALQDIVERTVTGLGYDLVEVELAGRGMLRVTIDLPAAQAAAPTAEGGLPPAIRLEDCERVSHQLSHVLEVERIEYARLEVSSPGVDRPLRKPADFERFVGHPVKLRLKAPFQGRKHFEGLLCRDDAETAGRWALEFVPPPPPARRPGSGKPVRSAGQTPKLAAEPTSLREPAAQEGASDEAVTIRRLSFMLDEVERARLVPTVKF